MKFRFFLFFFLFINSKAYLIFDQVYGLEKTDDDILFYRNPQNIYSIFFLQVAFTGIPELEGEKCLIKLYMFDISSGTNSIDLELDISYFNNIEGFSKYQRQSLRKIIKEGNVCSKHVIFLPIDAPEQNKIVQMENTQKLQASFCMQNLSMEELHELHESNTAILIDQSLDEILSIPFYNNKRLIGLVNIFPSFYSSCLLSKYIDMQRHANISTENNNPKKMMNISMYSIFKQAKQLKLRQNLYVKVGKSFLHILHSRLPKCENGMVVEEDAKIYEMSNVIVNSPEYRKILKARIMSALHLLDSWEVKTLILDAFGCYELGNDPVTVAQVFKEIFENVKFGYLRKVIFAIPNSRDNIKQKNLYRGFQTGLGLSLQANEERKV